MSKLHPAIKRITFTPDRKSIPRDRFLVVAYFHDRKWGKRFRTLQEAKWSRDWALEIGAIRAIITEDLER